MLVTCCLTVHLVELLRRLRQQILNLSITYSKCKFTYSNCAYSKFVPSTVDWNFPGFDISEFVLNHV